MHLLLSWVSYKENTVGQNTFKEGKGINLLKSKWSVYCFSLITFYRGLSSPPGFKINRL